MSLKSFVVSRVAERLLGEDKLAARREKTEAERQAKGEPHRVSYFHDAADPYAHLMAQVLADFAARYDVVFDAYLVGPPDDGAAPERELLASYSLEDARRLATKAGLAPPQGETPSAERVTAAEAALANSLARGTFLEDVNAISETLWSGGELPAGGDATSVRTAGDTKRDELGHYLGATLHYGGEWYWGLDRLHYLEERLDQLGLRKSGTSEKLIYPQPLSPSGSGKPAGAAPELHYYLSFRSPYTYIVAERVKALADAYGADLKLRFVLPMVMRNLPVPKVKGRYITMDTAREARRLGVPFGRVADPVGKPVERGCSILPWAIESGRGYDFCLSFMSGVWSEGIDAGSDSGMKQIVERAGLDWTHAKSLIGNDNWRETAEANRLELFDRGIWGVPSFRVGDVATWGQDRLWVIEDELKALANNGAAQ
ncbi:MAG: DsbA family protein [Pseudomonadota bacterium]